MAEIAIGGGGARVRTGLVVLICLAIAGIEGFDVQSFGIAAPKLAPELGLTPGQQGWAASAALIGLCVGAWIGGWLADRTGRKPVLTAAVAIFGAFSLATAFVHAYEPLLAVRFLTGLGFGAAMPNIIAIAVEISPPQRRAFTVTAMFGGMPFGGMLISIAARLLGPGLEWRDIFMAGGLIPLALVPAILLWLPETRPAHDPRQERNLARALFAEGRAPKTLLVWIALFMTQAVTFLLLNWLPTLVVARGFAAADGFAAAVAFNGLCVLGGMAGGVALDRVGYRWPIPLALTGLAGALVALGASATPAAMIALAGVVGFLLQAGQFSLYAVAPSLYPPAARGGGAGAAVGMARIGSVMGPLIAGSLRESGHTAGQVLAFLAPAGLLAALAIVMLGWLARHDEV
jgi:AAHS family 3-hydroxyphenylpropionic acid transporter